MAPKGSPPRFRIAWQRSGVLFRRPMYFDCGDWHYVSLVAFGRYIWLREIKPQSNAVENGGN